MSENIKCYSFSCLLMALWCCSLTAWASDALNRYKYNGKEVERTHGIDCLDYGARWYEPVIGRFTTMDPLSEKYYHISPYVYSPKNK